MNTTIVISRATLEELARLKYEESFPSYDAVIQLLLKLESQINPKIFKGKRIIE